MKHSILLTIACTLFVSCATTALHVRSEYYGRNNLASCEVDTPDPKKTSDQFGQRLIISWQVPYETFRQTPCAIILQVRLNNGEETIHTIPLKTASGTMFYPIFGADYTQKGGLQSYFASLESAGKSIAISHHKLWAVKLTHNQ